MSIYRVDSWFVGKGCFLWPVVFFQQKSVSLCPTSFCTPRPNLPVILVSPDFVFLHSNPLWWKEHPFFWVLILEDIVNSSKNRSTSASSASVFGARLRLPWCWMICLGNKLRSFCCFWDYTQVLHFAGGGNSNPLWQWQPTPVLLPGKSHGWRSLVGFSP